MFLATERRPRGMRRAALVPMLAACLSAAVPAAAEPAARGDLLIRNVRAVDLTGPVPRVVENASVLLRDGRIVFSGPQDTPLGAGTVVEAAGQTLLPGLTDMHVHLWDEAELGAYLAHGVTTVRNLSGMPFHLDLAARIERGELDGPRLLTSGPILNSRGPNLQINHQVVEDAEAARAAVRGQHEAGYRRVKVYSNLTRDAWEAIRAEADALGMTVTGHTPEGRRTPGIPLEAPFAIGFEELLDGRFETIEHVESIVWHGLRARQDEELARALGARIAAAGVAVTPTLLAHHNLYRVASEGRAVLERPGTEWLNPLVQAAEAENHAAWLERSPAPVLRDDRFYARVTKIFDEEGVLLVAGSDAGIFTNIPGRSLLEELELLAAAGIAPHAALRAATRNAARVLGESDRGCLAPGCVADLVLYACNPLDDLACLYAPVAVVRDGRLLDRSRLAALLASAATPDLARTAEQLRAGLAAQGGDPAILDALPLPPP